MPAKKTLAKTASKKKTATKKSTAITIAKTVKAVRAQKKLAMVAVSAPLATQKPRRLHLGMHVIIAGSAICVMLLLGVVGSGAFQTKESAAQDAVPATIGMEHHAPLSLSVLIAKKEHAGYASITNQSNETVYVSLPSAWTRTEVTGASLKDVTQEIPFFGFSRWTLPGKAGIKLLMPSAPDAIFFDPVSTSTAAIDLKTIDLTTLNVTSNVVLVQKQTLVKLWEGNE